MKIKQVATLALVSLCLLASSRANAQLEGTWDVTFTLPDGSPTVTFDFTPLLVFFSGETGAPQTCSWVGIDLALQGSSSSAIGIMTCDQLGTVPDFVGFLFNTRDKRTMNGVALTPSVFPPFVSFTGHVQ